MKATTYYDLQIKSLDEQYLDELGTAYGIDWRDLDISEFWTGDITNACFYMLLYKIAENEVEDYTDRTKIQEAIYTNCLDSGYDIDESELETQQAKDFINNF